MEKEKIIILLDFFEGPIWKGHFDPNTMESSTGVPIVDNDKELWEMNDKISNLYVGYYIFDDKDQIIGFDEEREKQDKEKLLSMIQDLKARLNEINDGSFEIEDRESERIKNL